MTPFSRWERELPKLVMDDRWRAVASMKQRRQLFDAFCKAAADGHKRGRASSKRSARDGFSALLNEAAAPRPPASGAAPLRSPLVRPLRLLWPRPRPCQASIPSLKAQATRGHDSGLHRPSQKSGERGNVIGCKV